MSGYFNIYVDQCGIGNAVYGGIPDDSDFTKKDNNNPNKKPEKKVKEGCNYVNEFSQCLSCVKGWTLKDGVCHKEGGKPASGPKFQVCSDG